MMNNIKKKKLTEISCGRLRFCYPSFLGSISHHLLLEAEDKTRLTMINSIKGKE